MKTPFASVPEAIEEIKRGRMIIVVDDEDRENEGDLVMAAEGLTPEAVNFMASVGKGLICTPLPKELAEKLDLHPMVRDNTSFHDTAFTVSIDLKEGISTGISAFDRAKTISALLDPATKACDFVRPGHVFPLVAKEGGVLRRAGHTEAAVDLAQLAGLAPVGVICEIMKDNGEMARLKDLEQLAREHQLKILTIKDLIQYQQDQRHLIEACGECTLPTEFGVFKLYAFQSHVHRHKEPHLALVKGDPEASDHALVRVHSECLTGDVLASFRCDCGPQLHQALAQIAKAPFGVLVYMRQEGRGIGLLNKIRAYHLQEQGLDTVEANEKLGFEPDLRDYGVGVQILKHLGVKKMRLLTNNPRKVVGLAGHGLELLERVPLEVAPRSENLHYLHTKKFKLGHFFNHL